MSYIYNFTPKNNTNFFFNIENVVLYDSFHFLVHVGVEEEDVIRGVLDILVELDDTPHGGPQIDSVDRGAY